MGKIKNAGLGIGPKGGVVDGGSNQVDDKIDELTAKNTPFDSSTFSYEESVRKYDDYLLNKNHDIGGSKAKFLSETLGYNKGDGLKLHNAVSEAINGKIPDKVIKTPHGIKSTFNTRIKGNDGRYRYANIVVVIQKDNGKTMWRLITITPNKKDK